MPSREEVRELRRIAAEDPDPRVAGRAAVVLAELRRLEGGRVDRADPVAATVSARTARTWHARWRESGRDGLLDRPRGGRPRDEVATEQVLRAALVVSSDRLTSYDVARASGHSQSTVVRVWRDVFATGDPHELLAGRRWALVGAEVAGGASTLVLADRGPSTASPSAAFARSPRRPALQVVLAGDLGPSRGDAGPASLLDQVRAQHGPRRLVVLTRSAVPEGEDGSTLDAAGWQALLPGLVQSVTESPLDQLTALRRRVVDAASSPAPLVWVAPPAVAAARPREPVAARPHSAVVADMVLAAIHQRIADGRLAAGDRITESWLSREVHASRGHVRDALLQLAGTGLVELEPHRGACVPRLSAGDVVEAYAARRALGTLLVRRAATAPSGGLADAERALDRLVDVGRTGDSRAAGWADLAFQDSLARCTRMRRIPGMFENLTAQIWMFCAVLGVRYAYAVDAMVADDSMLLAHLLAHDEAAAVSAWHTKMDDALAYMLAQLEPA